MSYQYFLSVFTFLEMEFHLAGVRAQTARQHGNHGMYIIFCFKAPFVYFDLCCMLIFSFAFHVTANFQHSDHLV